MHTDATPKQTPTGDANPTAGHTDSQTVPNQCRFDKLFNSVRGAYALHGRALHRADPIDGPVTYWAERWGLVRYLPKIDTVRRLLEQIGGRL